MKLPSGKFVLRMTPSQHLALRQAAEAHDTSLNDWIVQKLFSAENLSSSVVEIILSAFAKDVQAIILFGSVARGDQDQTSDIDLLIVLESSRPIDRGLYHLWDKKIMPVLGIQYSPQFCHRTKLESASSLWLEVALDGKILFDEDKRIEADMQTLRHKIAAGEYLRKMSHGHSYWVKRADNEE